MPLRALRSHPSPLYRLPGTALVLMVCGLALAVTLALTASFAWRDREASFREASEVAGNVSLLVAEHAARLIETSDLILKQVLQAVGPDPLPSAGDRGVWDRLSALGQSASYLVAIWVTDAEGKAVLTTRQFPAPGGLNVADRDYYRTHRVGRGEGDGDLFIGHLDTNRISNDPLLLLSRALPAEPGQFRGVAVVAVTPRYIRSIYRSLDISYERAIALRKVDGTVLLREASGAAAWSDGEDIVVRRPVEGTELLVEVAIPTASILSHWHERLITYASYALAAMGAVAVIGALAVQRTRRERQAEDALQHAYDTLEERVHRRTAELEETNTRLEHALVDKEVLLKEVQHRVKNNLQVICSLLRLQAGQIDERARRGFDESLRRIQSMSLLHELLYRSDQPARIDLAEFLRQLCDGLVRSTNPTGARLTLDVRDWVVDVDQATPLALIASELVSNALLHAFPSGHPGTVTVSLQPAAGGMQLIVGDDGVGLPPGLPSPQRRKDGLGLSLVQALTHQAGATLQIERSHGTSFTLTIPETAARRSKAA